MSLNAFSRRGLIGDSVITLPKVVIKSIIRFPLRNRIEILFSNKKNRKSICCPWKRLNYNVIAV